MNTLAVHELSKIRLRLESTLSESMADGSVKAFLMVLRSKLTQYDKKLIDKEMQRGGRGNIYRLGHYLEAADRVEQDLRSNLDKEDSATMEKLKTSLQFRFSPDFPPVKNVLKQIEAWEAKGKKPSITA